MSCPRLVALALLAVCAGAQEPEPVFRTSTRLVQVDVVVQSRGKPVTGLTRDDFEVYDNGVRQEIAVFSVRKAAEARPAADLQPGTVTNWPRSGGPEPVAATVILLDAQNTEWGDQAFARQQAVKFLERASRREMMAVYALDTKLRVLQGFSADPVGLRAAVERFQPAQSLTLQDGQDGLLAGLRGNAANAMRAANFQRRADVTTMAFEALARHLDGLPGRKKLIWITAALPLTYTQTNERNGADMVEFTNLSSQIFAPMKRLNDANVALYPVDPRGVGQVDLSDPGITTMLQLAAMTGGKAFYNDNGVAEGIAEAVADTDLTYTLGFYPTESAMDGRAHSIQVAVRREGVEARHRMSYSAEAPAPKLTDKVRRATLNAWVQEPVDATGVHVLAGAAPSWGRPGYFDVEVAVEAAGLRLEARNGRLTGNFELAVTPEVEKKPKGLHQTIKVNLLPEQVANGAWVTVSNQVKVTNNQGKLLSDWLRVVVMDSATAKAGSVRIPIAAAP